MNGRKCTTIRLSQFIGIGSPEKSEEFIATEEAMGKN
jgi:hypothetical protein